MSFMSNLVYVLGVVDAVLIMAFGVVVAAAFLFSKKELLDGVWDRVFPALMTIVGCSVAAALVLGAIRWLLGMGM